MMEIDATANNLNQDNDYNIILERLWKNNNLINCRNDLEPIEISIVLGGGLNEAVTTHRLGTRCITI